MTQPQHPYYAQPAPKKGMSSKMIFGIIAAVLAFVLLCCAGAAILLWKSGTFQEAVAKSAGDPSFAQVDDCLTDPGDPDDVRVTDCSNAEAAHKILHVVDGKTRLDGWAECRTQRNVYTYLFIADNDREQSLGRTLCLGANRASN